MQGSGVLGFSGAGFELWEVTVRTWVLWLQPLRLYSVRPKALNPEALEIIMRARSGPIRAPKPGTVDSRKHRS